MSGSGSQGQSRCPSNENQRETREILPAFNTASSSGHLGHLWRVDSTPDMPPRRSLTALPASFLHWNEKFTVHKFCGATGPERPPWQAQTWQGTLLAHFALAPMPGQVSLPVSSHPKVIRSHLNATRSHCWKAWWSGACLLGGGILHGDACCLTNSGERGEIRHLAALLPVGSAAKIALISSSRLQAEISGERV